MKYFALLFCVLLGTSSAIPRPVSHAPVLDVLELLEKIVEHEGQVLLEKVIQLVHVVQEGLFEVKSSVPKAYERLHQEVDEVLEGLRDVYDKIAELLEKKDVAYGFDLLGGLTELTGGTKLSTVLSLISLADKAYRVVNDAKEFVPNLERTMNRIQAKISVAVIHLTNQVVREMGLENFIALSVTDKIENLMDEVEDKAHALVLDLLHKIQQALDVMKTDLPEIYESLEHRIEEIRELIDSIVKDVEKTLHVGGYSLLDIAGDFTGGTSLGTVIKVMSLIEKFNAVVQDVRQFGPHAEQLLHHTVQKVAESAQEFLTHAADLLMA